MLLWVINDYTYVRKNAEMKKVGVTSGSTQMSTILPIFVL